LFTGLVVECNNTTRKKDEKGTNAMCKKRKVIWSQNVTGNPGTRDLETLKVPGSLTPLLFSKLSSTL
jgi:hypothetical protein